ncbi:prephenate dehydrogenase/arogenate dehydrogenase family protein [Desulfocurvus sp. DL9XJH121]
MNIGDMVIVGSEGRMGRMLGARAEAAGLAVRGVDRPLTPESVARAVRGADLVLLAVPAEVLGEVADLCASAMEPGQVLADICSVKALPLSQMLAAHSGPVVGTHPLFGPEPQGDDLRVAVVPGRDDHAAEAVAALMRTLGFTPFAAEAKSHDKAMALIQGLNFVTTVSYLATLANHPEIVDFATPSLHRRLDAARKMLTQDSELFSGLLEVNPYTQEAVRGFRSMLNIAAGGDIELLAERANWWWQNEHTRGDV